MDCECCPMKHDVKVSYDWVLSNQINMHLGGSQMQYVHSFILNTWAKRTSMHRPRPALSIIDLEIFAQFQLIGPITQPKIIPS